MNWKKTKIIAIVVLAIFIVHQILSGNYWFFSNLIKKTYAEEQLVKQNIVLVFVEKKLYDNLKDELVRYSRNYIQEKNPNTIALTLPIDKDTTAIEILKIVQNLYFEGVKDQPSSLKGLVLVGDLPLPVINDEGVIFPSIWPYVDLKNVSYVFDFKSRFFVPTGVGDNKAEIWHGRILMDTVQQYKRYFSKLKKYKTGENSLSDKIWYDNFLMDSKTLNPQNFKLYLLGLIFAQDRAYHRYSDKLLTLLQYIVSKGTSQNLVEVISNIDDKISQEKEISKSADEYMKDYVSISNEALSKIKNYADTTLSQLQTYLSQIQEINVPTYQEFLFAEKNYFKSFNESFGSSRNDNLVRDIQALGYDDFEKVDSASKFMDVNRAKVINSYNHELEEALKKEVYKYALKDLVPRGYIHREGKLLRCEYDPDKDIEKTRSELALYQEYSGYYFGSPVKKFLFPRNFYFGDFWSGKILKGKYEFDGESPELLKPFLSQQVEANRGYDILNVEKDYKEAKKAIESNCLSKWILTKWGGATPLNLDDSQRLKKFLPNLMFFDVFERGGMKIVSQGYLNDFRGFKNYIYLNFVRNSPNGKFVFDYPPCSRSTKNAFKRSEEVDFLSIAVEKYFQDASSEDSSTRINIFSGDKLVASWWTGAIVNYVCSDIKGTLKYSNNYTQYDYKIYPTVIFHTHPTEEDLSSTNFVTLDRGINKKRGLSFKGVGGDFLRWDFPNFLEVKIYLKEGDSYKLKKPEEIEEAIKEYLRQKIHEYNDSLKQQLQKKDAYIILYKSGFDMLSSVDPKLAPFEYDLLPEDFLIKIVGDKKIKKIAHILWLQHQGWSFIRLSGTSVEEVLDSFISQYNIEEALDTRVKNYLYSDNTQKIPGYQDEGYQVGVWIGAPSDRGNNVDFGEDEAYTNLKQQQKENLSRDLSLYGDANEILNRIESKNYQADDACGIPPDGKVSIWEWMGKISCRLNQISTFSSENVVKITPNQCKIKAGGIKSSIKDNFAALNSIGVEEVVVDEFAINQKGQITLTTTSPVILEITSSGGCVEMQNINSCDQPIELFLEGQTEIPFVVSSSFGGDLTLQMRFCDEGGKCVNIDKKILTSTTPSKLVLNVVPDVIPPGGQAQIHVKVLSKNGQPLKYLTTPVKLQTSLGELVSWLGERGKSIEIYNLEKPIVLDFSRLGGDVSDETAVLQALNEDLSAEKQVKIRKISANLQDLRIISGDYKGLGARLWLGKLYLEQASKPYSYFVRLFSENNKIIPGELSGDVFVFKDMFIVPQDGQQVAFLEVPHKEEEKLFLEIAAQKEALKSFAPLILKPFKVVIKGPSQIKQKEDFYVKVTDRRGNELDQKVYLEVYGSANLSFPKSVISQKGNAKIPVIPLGKGKARIGVNIKGIKDTLPDVKQIEIIRDEGIDFGRLNVGYFNWFGVGGGNIWGYMDKVYKAPKEFLGESNKGVAFTTMLVSPQNLRKSVAVISNDHILANQEVTLQIRNNVNLILGEGWKLPVKIKRFDMQLGSIGKAMGLNKQKNAIFDGDKEILSYKNGTLTATGEVNNLKIKNNKGIINYQGREIGTFEVEFDNILQTQPIVLKQNLRAILGWVEGSTNGEKGRLIIDDTSSYQKLYSKGIEGVLEEKAFPIGFRDGFKNISYFIGGNSVGEATKPFQTPFVINFGDPVFNNSFDPELGGEVRYSKNLGQNVFFDKENIISVDIGDFNNDGLEDIFVFKLNGEVKLLKNYGGKGSRALEEMGNIIKIPQPIKKGWVGNIDGDGFEDIIVQTKDGNLFVFLNHEGIIDIDPYPLCFGENKDDISQLFVDDFDGDGFEDFLINSQTNGIRLFYGKKPNPYISKNLKECKVDERKFDIKILKTWKILLDSSPKKDLSLVRRKGLEILAKDSSEQVEKEMDKGITVSKDLYDRISKLGWPWKIILPPTMIPALYDGYMKKNPLLPSQLKDKLPDAITVSSKYNNDSLKYQFLPSQFGFDEDKNQGDETVFAKMAYLTGSDPISIVKYFEGPTVIKPGDKVNIHIVFDGSYQPVVYYEKLLGPWEIVTKNGEMDVVFSGNIKGDFLIGEDVVPRGFLFGFNGQVGKGEIIYTVSYKGGVGYNVEVERVNKDLRGELKNTLPNLIFLPTDGCQKKYEYLTNENNLGKNARNYEKQLIDVDKYDLQKQQEQQDRIEQIQQNLSLDKIGSLLPQEATACDYENISDDQIVKQDLMSFGKSLINGKCGGASDCGIPTPFNMAFFSPGMYNIWGLPIMFDPGLTVTPWTFPWFRLYLSPTLTANLGIAACFGPYMVDVPPPFGVVAGKCLVTAIDFPCNGEGGEDFGQGCSSIAADKDGLISDEGAPPQQAFKDKLRCKNPMPGISPSQISPLIVENQGGEAFYAGNYSPATVKEKFNIVVGADGIADIEGIQLQPGYDVGASIQDGLIVGLIESLIKKWLDKQIEYIINNFTHFSIYVILPKIDDLGKGFASLDIAQVARAINYSLTPANEPVKEALNRSQRTNPNPFKELEKMFKEVPLIDIRIKDILIQYPDVSSSGFVYFEAQLGKWSQKNKLRIKQRKELLENLENAPSNGLTAAQKNFNKQRKELIKGVLKKLERNQQIVEYNLEMIKAYQHLPLKLYEYKHIIDQGVDAILCVLEDFLASINYWLSDNASRFEAWVDAIILGLTAIDTFQVIIDFTVNWKSRCGKCRVDNYDFHSFITSLLSIDLPIIPIPPFKLPDIYVDFSKIKLGTTLILPNLNFKPYKLELPGLPTIPPPPATYLSLDPNFKIDIPIMQKLPPPPELPEISIGLPKVEVNLPVLPPAPEIPNIMPVLKAIVDVMDVLGNVVFCLIKGGIGLVAEWNVKSRIEQLTQRKQRVFPFDYLRIRIPQPPLKGKDLLFETQIGLEITLKPLYDQLKNFADFRNSQLDSSLKQFKTKIEGVTNQPNKARVDNINADFELQLNLQTPTQSYNFITPQEALKHIDKWINIVDLAYQKANSTQKEKLIKIKNRLVLLKNLEIKPNVKQIDQLRIALKNYFDYYKNVQFQKIQKIQTSKPSSVSLISMSDIGNLSLRMPFFDISLEPSAVFAQQQTLTTPLSTSRGEVMSLDGALWDRGDDKKYYNVLGDTKLAKKIYENRQYIKKDINQDGVLDLLRWDKNTVNVKFGQNNDFMGAKALKVDGNVYMAPQNREKSLSNGMLTLQGKKFIVGKKLGTAWLKTTLQDYENVKWKWYSLSGVDEYKMDLRLRVDDFVDKGYWTKKYGLDTKEFRISQRDEADEKVITTDLSSTWVNISLGEKILKQRRWRYGKIGYFDSVGVYLDVGGRSLIGDKAPPSIIGEFFRPSTDEKRIGTAFRGLIDTHYILKIKVTDNVEVSSLVLLNESGDIVAQSSGTDLQISLFETHPIQKTFLAIATDWKGNSAKEKIKVFLELPSIDINKTLTEEKTLDLQALMSQDVDEGIVKFQVCTQTVGGDCTWEDIKQIPIEQLYLYPQRDEVVGNVLFDGWMKILTPDNKQIAMINIKTLEIKKLSQGVQLIVNFKKGWAELQILYQGKVVYELPLVGGKLQDVKMLTPTYMMKDISEGYCILQGMDNQCRALLDYSGSLFVSKPYNNLWQGVYKWDGDNVQIFVEDEQGRDIMVYDFNPSIWVGN